MKHEVIITIDGKEILNIPKDTEVCEYHSTARVLTCKESSMIRNPIEGWYILKQFEQYATDVLRVKGYLFLNQVYDMLGMTLTREGAVLGWRYEDGKYVSFGLSNKEPVKGDSHEFILRFNVDGCILEHLS